MTSSGAFRHLEDESDEDLPLNHACTTHHSSNPSGDVPSSSFTNPKSRRYKSPDEVFGPSHIFEAQIRRLSNLGISQTEYDTLYPRT